ncbi:MAG: pilus assembly protein [Verrucomicrobiae bacterium]|nr:pilus assembly protein [Verrucomicrobiae bacterium]
MKGIADTGFLVAFASVNDVHHEWALSVASRVTEPLLTCESVLSEAAFNLDDSHRVLAMIRDGLVMVAFDCNDHLHHLEELARRYADQNPDFADLCLIRMSELNPDYSVITTDRRDFHIYRRNKREAIPLICPPEK